MISLEKNRKDLPATWTATVRREIETHSSDSKAFIGKEDVFYSVKGLGDGIWGLRNYESTIDAPVDLTISSEGNASPERKEVTNSRVIRDTKLSREVKAFYQHRCQICGKTIVLRDRRYSEAHHLIPLGDVRKGPDTKDHIIVLCPNHHVEFDYGSIAINPYTMLIEHIDPDDPENGKPFASKHELSEVSLHYHYDRIFG